MNDKTSIITIASSKGGVGKSTVCIMLAGALLARRQTVQIIDVDENATVARWHQAHKVDAPGLKVSKSDPKTFSTALAEAKDDKPDYILIDVAGVYEKTLLLAMARSDLIIIPAQPSEPDLHEALKIIRDLSDLNDSFSQSVAYRILLNQCDPLHPHYQSHIFSEVERLQLSRFETLMHKRAPYREAFMNGRLPHLTDAPRESVRKAIAEIDAIVGEIDAALYRTERKRAA